MGAAIDIPFELDATHRRVLNIIQEASQPLENNSTGLFEEFVLQRESFFDELEFKPTEQKHLHDCGRSKNDIICRMLLEAVREASNHIKKLDDVVRQLVELKIIFASFQVSELAHRVVDVLKRLSETPRPYHEEDEEKFASRMDSAFFGHEDNEQASCNLQVMNCLPTPVLQLAVLVALPVPHRQNWHGQATRDFVNKLADCLEITLGMKPEASFGAAQLFVVRSYLWNMWHRSLTLHRHYILRLHLGFGFTYPVHQVLRTRGLRIEQIVRNQWRKRHEPSDVDSKTPEHMNRKVLDLLRADPSATGVDYNPLYHHFERALRNSSSVDPFLHTPHCNGCCSYITREENDFESLPTTVAVDLLPAHETTLHYCKASAQTMSISAFWAQTREEATNSCATYPMCWHELFCTLAQNSGCDSYWIDTVCLPVEKTARRRAMQSVNSIFEKSKLTVICDRSVMALDKMDQGEDCCSYMEKILATMLVCDWNLEAWGLVAAFKGAQKLHLLCKDDVLLPVHAVIQAVYQGGSIELANLSLFSYHILQPSTSWVLSSMKPILWSNNSTGVFAVRNTRALDIEEAGRLLDYRHTSNETDRIHIWCLLTGVPMVDTAREFWWHIRRIHTGYIFSAMPRIQKHEDFTWAPIGPGLWNAREGLPFYKIQQSVWHYQQSEIAENISTSGNHLKGLSAVWHFCSLEHFNLTKNIIPVMGHIFGIAGRLMKDRSDMGLINTIKSLKSAIGPMPTNGEEWHVQNKMVLHTNKIMAAWHFLQLPATSRKELSRILKEFAPGRGHLALIYPNRREWGHSDCTEASIGSDTLALAVITSEGGDQFGTKWRWLGVTDWDRRVQLPFFQKRGVTLA